MKQYWHNGRLESSNQFLVLAPLERRHPAEGGENQEPREPLQQQQQRLSTHSLINLPIHTPHSSHLSFPTISSTRVSDAPTSHFITSRCPCPGHRLRRQMLATSPKYATCTISTRVNRQDAWVRIVIGLRVEDRTFKG